MQSRNQHVGICCLVCELPAGMSGFPLACWALVDQIHTHSRSLHQVTNAQSTLSRRQFLTPHLTTAALATGTTAATRSAAAATDSKYQIIAFSNPFQNLSYSVTADMVAEGGWDGIECPVRPKGQIEPERAADELPKLVEALKKRGKEIGLITTGIRSVKDPHAESVLRTAAKLSALGTSSREIFVFVETLESGGAGCFLTSATIEVAEQRDKETGC